MVWVLANLVLAAECGGRGDRSVPTIGGVCRCDVIDEHAVLGGVGCIVEKFMAAQRDYNAELSAHVQQESTFGPISMLLNS